MRDLSQRIDKLSPKQRALLELYLIKNKASLAEDRMIPRREPTESCPLSYTQQSLWIVDQLYPNIPMYNTHKAIRIRGALNVEALKKSLDAIVERHESLRTTFRGPLQVIAKSWSVDLPVIDVYKFPPLERYKEIQRLLQTEVRRPFDLSKDLMLRAILLRLEPEEYMLLLVIHHIATDGWSTGVLYRDLGEFYKAFSADVQPQLPELSIQYADYAVWQRQWLQGDRLEAQNSYWKKKLEGAPPLLALPTDYTRPSVQAFRGARQTLVLPEPLVDDLRALSLREEVTLFMILLAAFKTLLYRYTGQEDILVGSTIANRNHVQTEELIGFFSNTLVLRTDLSGNPRFLDLLNRVKEVTLDAYAHQDLPFERLVGELKLDRNLSYNPIFQVMFTLQNAPKETLEMPGLMVTTEEIEDFTVKFDITISLIEDERGVTGWLEYNTELFEQATITRIVYHFQTLLEAIAADPEQRISKLPPLTDSEKHQLLVEWCNTRADYPRDKCIHELFESQVEQTPDLTALIFGDQKLTYRELNSQANQLAYYLKKFGVGLEKPVGIFLERSLEMVVGLLGILKACGTYVPLDPTYPRERLAFMIEDTKVPVLLTQEALIAKLPEHQAKTICLDSDWNAIAQESSENLPDEAKPENLAYVMYTSGSTGRPKGVEIPHRGVIRLLFGVDYAQLGSDLPILQMAPISFDASTFEIWGALLHGATCVIFPDRIPTTEAIESSIRKNGVKTLWLTASLFNAVIDKAPETLSGIQQLLIGGEALSVHHVHRALELLPNTQIINGYGPTECTTFACCYRIPRQISKSMWNFEKVPSNLLKLFQSLRSIPIGRPIGNTEVYLLDSQLQPVPIGIPGELHIGGDGLARGYLNQPELTAEKFVPNPFSQEPGARLYKTGDMARYLPDGNIEFLGRLDNQVKIRGFRIELGEVETVLGQHPDVREAVVTAREDIPGDKRLVAYVVPCGDRKPNVSQLHSFLSQRLPDYMVPSIFMTLDAIPLTPNGKVDRRALPVPDQSRPEIEAAYIAPRTSIERQIADVWIKFLGLEKVGVHDNFFELGGHSLLATQVVSRLRELFQVELPLRDLFETPTVAGLSEGIELLLWAKQEAQTSPSSADADVEEVEL